MTAGLVRRTRQIDWTPMERVTPGKKIPRNPKKAPRTEDEPRLSARAPRYTATK